MEESYLIRSPLTDFCLNVNYGSCGFQPAGAGLESDTDNIGSCSHFIPPENGLTDLDEVATDLDEVDALLEEGTNIGSCSQTIPDATENVVTEEGTAWSHGRRACWRDSEPWQKDIPVACGLQPAVAGLESDTGSMSKRIPDATQDFITEECTNFGSTSQTIPDATKMELITDNIGSYASENIITEEGTARSRSRRARWTDPQSIFLLKFLKKAGSRIDWDLVARAMKANFPDSNFTIQQLKQKVRDLRKSLNRKFKGRTSDSNKENIPFFLADVFKAEVKPGGNVGAAKSSSSSIGLCITLFNELKGLGNFDTVKDISHAVEIFKSAEHRDVFVVMEENQRAVWIQDMINRRKKNKAGLDFV